MTEQMHPEDPSSAARSLAPFTVTDVYLLTAESDGRVAVPGLCVVVDTTGLTVRRPDGAVAAVVAWSDVRGLTAHRRMRTPAGSSGVVVEVVTSSRTHHFLVPTDDAEGLERDITAFAADAGGQESRRSRRARKRTWWRRGSRPQSSAQPAP